MSRPPTTRLPPSPRPRPTCHLLCAGCRGHSHGSDATCPLACGPLAGGPTSHRHLRPPWILPAVLGYVRGAFGWPSRPAHLEGGRAGTDSPAILLQPPAPRLVREAQRQSPAAGQPRRWSSISRPPQDPIKGGHEGDRKSSQVLVPASRRLSLGLNDAWTCGPRALPDIHPICLGQLLSPGDLRGADDSGSQVSPPELPFRVATGGREGGLERGFCLAPGQAAGSVQALPCPAVTQLRVLRQDGRELSLQAREPGCSSSSACGRLRPWHLPRPASASSTWSVG